MGKSIGNTLVTGRVDRLTAPVLYSRTSASETTPDVSNVDVLIMQNIGAVTVTSFLRGYYNQVLRVLGDGNTTIQNNAVINTNTGANKLLAASKVYTFSLINGVWYENA